MEVQRKLAQEEQDRQLAHQLNKQYNTRGANSGHNSPPSTPSRTPRSRRQSSTPSRSPSPRGRRASQYAHYRRQTPPKNSIPHSQHVHPGSQHGGGSSHYDFDTQDFMRIQQEPIFQQYVERYLEQNKDKFLESLINKGARVPYNFDVDNKIQKQNPSQEE